MKYTPKRLLIVGFVLGSTAIAAAQEGIDVQLTDASRVALKFIRGKDHKPATNITSDDGTVVLKIEVGRNARGFKTRFVRLYKTDTGEAVGPPIQPDRIFSLALSPDNRTIAVGGVWSDGGGSLEIWDGITERLLYKWQSATIYKVTFSNDGKMLEIVRGPKPKS